MSGERCVWAPVLLCVMSPMSAAFSAPAAQSWERGMFQPRGQNLVLTRLASISSERRAMTDDIYRVFSFGKPIGDVMNEVELAALQESISANAACGLADPVSLVVEKFEEDGGWKVCRVVDRWEAPPEFSNPNGHDG
jgi:hypothetical protein